MPVILAALGAPCAFGCVAEDRGLRREMEAMRAEMRTLERESAETAKRVESLSAAVDSLSARSTKSSPECRGVPGECAPPLAGPAPAPEPRSDVRVPPNLAVVKVEPPRDGEAISRPKKRKAPRLPTELPLAEPDARALAALGPPGENLSADARADLELARAQSGLAAARALEAFTARYPHHPSADNALVEAAKIRWEAGEMEGACALYARCVNEYPA